MVAAGGGHAGVAGEPEDGHGHGHGDGEVVQGGHDMGPVAGVDLRGAFTQAAARGCSQTVHFTYAFQARALYERNGYELVGRVEDFPSGTDVLWYRKRLNPPKAHPSRERSRSESPARTPPP